MRRRSTSERFTPAADKNLLWALSGGVCAAPGCNVNLVESTGRTRVTTGRIAHIHAHSPGGPRWVSPHSPEYLDSYNNLILLCDRHHSIVDGDVATYTAEILTGWKRVREDQALATAAITASSVLPNPPQLTAPFTSRSHLSETVVEALRDTSMVALVGLSGAGKSQLAVEYVRNSHKGSLRIWLDASSRDSLETQLSDMALALEPQLASSSVARRARWAVERISETSGSICVFDNAPSHELIEDFFPAATQVLVTSQSQAWPGFQRVQVGPMEHGEAVKLLASITGQDDTSLDETAGLARHIPLVLKHIGRYMAMQNITAARTNRMLRDNLDAVAARGAARDEPTLGVVIDIVSQTLPDDALLLAEAIAQLHDTPLPLEPIAQLEEPFDAYATDLGLEDALAPLLRYSFLTRDGDTVQMHALVAERIRANANPNARLARLLAYALLSRIPAYISNLEHRALYHLLIPHAVALLEGASDEEETLQHWLVNKVAAYFTEIGRPDRAAGLLSGALDTPSEGSDLLGSLTHNLANAFFERGELEDAFRQAQRALEIKRTEVEESETSAYLATTYVLLADIEYERGDHGAGVDGNRRAAEMFLQDGYPVQAAGALMTVASRLIQERAESPDSVGEILSRVEECLDTPEGRGAYSHQFRFALVKAEFAIAMNDFPQAARLALNARREALKADEPLDVVRAIVMQAEALHHVNPQFSTGALLLQGVEALDRARDTGLLAKERARGNLALQFARYGDLARARQLAETSRRELARILPHDHPTLVVANDICEGLGAAPD